MRQFTIRFDHEYMGENLYFSFKRNGLRQQFNTTKNVEEANVYCQVGLVDELVRIMSYTVNQALPIYSNIRIRAYHGSRS